MNKPIYLVLEFDDDIIYIPFKNLESVDNYTVGFDNLLELSSSIIDILKLDINKTAILDIYLSEDLAQITDDMQEFNKRYLAVKYKRDDYNKNDLVRSFINYFINNLHNNIFDEFSGLKNVFDNYNKKYGYKGYLKDEDIKRIALLYLGEDYKRYKECYYKLKDKKIKIKTDDEVAYKNYSANDIYEEDKMLLVMFTNKSIDELKEYIALERNISRKR